MDNALRYTSSILTGSIQMTAAFLIFAVLAFLMWKSSRKSGRAKTAGNVMLISAIPGIAMALLPVVMWGAAFVRMSSQIREGVFEYVDFMSKNAFLYDFPSLLAMVTIFVFPVFSLTSIVCGILFILKKASKTLGILSLVFGVLSLGFFGLLILIAVAFRFG